jgi:hypothetical protein
LAGFGERLEVFSQPVLFVSPLPEVASSLITTSLGTDLPQFDAILSLDLAPAKDVFATWVSGLLTYLSRRGKMVFAYRLSAVQPLESLFGTSGVEPEWAIWVHEIQALIAQKEDRAGRIENLQMTLGAGVKVEWQTRSYVHTRRFTPHQAAEVLDTAGDSSLFGQLRQKSGSHWPQVRRALFAGLTNHDGQWHHGYGYLSIQFVEEGSA